MNVPTLAHPVPRKDIHIKINGTFSMGLLIIEIEEDGTSTVADTTEWEVYLQVRKEPAADSPVLLEASTQNGRILTGIQGEGSDTVNIDIKIPASDTAGVDYTGYAGYDLLCIFPGGDRDYYLAGQAVITPAYSWGGV